MLSSTRNRLVTRQRHRGVFVCGRTFTRNRSTSTTQANVSFKCVATRSNPTISPTLNSVVMRRCFREAFWNTVRSRWEFDAVVSRNRGFVRQSSFGRSPAYRRKCAVLPSCHGERSSCDSGHWETRNSCGAI